MYTLLHIRVRLGLAAQVIPPSLSVTSASYLQSFMRLISNKLLLFHGTDIRRLIEIKQEPNKRGGDEGHWPAWKASKLVKENEKQGGWSSLLLMPKTMFQGCTSNPSWMFEHLSNTKWQ